LQAVGPLDPIPLGKFGVGQISVSCAYCTVYIVKLRFANEAAARHYVGEGNYQEETIDSVLNFVTEEWVLFGDGTAYSRDDDRPIPMTITTETHPTFSDIITPTTIDLNNGAFIWTRRSDDPASVDFLKFDLTTGAEFTGGQGIDFCIGINARTLRCGYFYPADDHPIGFEIAFAGCDPITFTACLETDADTCEAIDGWCYSASGIYAEDSDPTCRRWAMIAIYATANGGDCNEQFPLGQIDVYSGPDCPDTGAATWRWIECTHDPRDCPTAADFELIWNFECPGASITSISCDCGGGGGSNNCPPESCPNSYCKWQWDTAHNVWVLLESNCIGLYECPDPPADPEITDIPWVECNCCIEIVPACPGDTPLCPDPCGWVWDAGGNVWTTAGCVGASEGCNCEGMPERDGLFDGETVEGYCCEPP